MPVSMNELTSANLHAFQKRFQLGGGRLRAFRVRTGSRSTTAELRLLVRDNQTNGLARLRLVFDGVEEYRFQRRPGTNPRKLTEVRFGFFGDLTYLNLDAFPEDGPPKVMDFRASDCFLAGRTVRWEIQKRDHESHESHE
jgi:hypothetical protein